MTQYSLDIQLAAVQAYLEGKESYKETAQRFQVDITNLNRNAARLFNKNFTHKILIFSINDCQYLMFLPLSVYLC